VSIPKLFIKSLQLSMNIIYAVCLYKKIYSLSHVNTEVMFLIVIILSLISVFIFSHTKQK